MATIYNFDEAVIQEARQKLNSHPLLRLNHLQTIEDLRKFMEYHVFAVWDFMSLLKSLQREIAPESQIWFPSPYDPEIVRLINEIVMVEESDETPSSGHASHFHLYLTAMREVGADYSLVLQFIETLKQYVMDVGDLTFQDWEMFIQKSDDDYWAQFDCVVLPDGIREFVTSTMKVVTSGKPHCIAASFCYGREDVIPSMFKYLSKQLDVNSQKAPFFDFYLQRHIQVDGEDHGPSAKKLVNLLCEKDPLRVKEAEQAALDAINARIAFWDHLEKNIK